MTLNKYLARRIYIGRRPFGSYWCLGAPNQIFGPGTEAAGETLCLKDCITQSNSVQVRKLEDFSSFSGVCKDGWGNHGGVGHSSKRIWLAALPRGIKTVWEDRPLLLLAIFDEGPKSYGGIKYCVKSCHHQVPAVLTQLREAVTECASKFPVPVLPVIICFASQCTWIFVQFSWAAFIGRTSKCRTTKLLWQICSHHNRPDEGTLQQSSREFHFELSILSILLRSGKI